MAVKDTTIHAKINTSVKKECRKILKIHGLSESKVISLIINEIAFRNGISIILNLWSEEKNRELAGINRLMNESNEDD